MARYTYTATAEDGSQHTRSTDRDYAYAILVSGGQKYRDDPTEGWGAWGFSGDRVNAEKTANTARRCYAKVAVVPVERVEHKVGRVVKFNPARRDALRATAEANGWALDADEQYRRDLFARGEVKIYVYYGTSGIVLDRAGREFAGQRSWGAENAAYGTQTAKVAKISGWLTA